MLLSMRRISIETGGDMDNYIEMIFKSQLKLLPIHNTHKK